MLQRITSGNEHHSECRKCVSCTRTIYIWISLCEWMTKHNRNKFASYVVLAYVANARALPFHIAVHLKINWNSTKALKQLIDWQLCLPREFPFELLLTFTDLIPLRFMFSPDIAFSAKLTSAAHSPLNRLFLLMYGGKIPFTGTIINCERNLPHAILFDWKLISFRFH